MKGTDRSSDSTVTLGFTGVGERGESLLSLCAEMDDVELPAVCDVQERRLDAAQEVVTAADRSAPEQYVDHETMLEDEDLDGVIIATPWRTHIPMAIEAMEAGIWPGLEVGPASSIEECWDLVRTAEETGQHCMLLENACFSRSRLAALNMVREGLFGEIIHCQTGYIHDIREEIHGGRETRLAERDGMGYRTLHFLHRNADVYPTHGIGPVAKYLNVNRGNRFRSLTATASKSRGLERWAEEHLPEDAPTRDRDWDIGDVVTTVIECANGETVIVNHDCSSPRPRTKRGVLQGTNGLWEPDHDGIHIEGRTPDHEWESFEEYQAEYDHSLWEDYSEEGVRSGHGGVDYLVLRSFVQSVAQDVRPPIDVYDTAAWMAITPLTEQSIAQGSDSVTFPDFTNGEWLVDEPIFGLTGDVGPDRLDFETLI